MITFKQFIDEGINDKGILKAVFIVGIPGAGKSYTISKLGGTIGPRIINIDASTEFLSKKFDIPSTDQNWHSFFKDKTHRIVKETVYQYVNSMLPLFVDGTSNDVSNVLRRIGVLESLGYDVGMVFINTNLDHAISRAEERAKKINRHVQADFIKKVHEISETNREYFRSKLKFFKEVSNNPGELTDEVMQQLFKSVAGFYSAPLENPVGQRALAELKQAGEKYLVPTIVSEQSLKRQVAAWYR